MIPGGEDFDVQEFLAALQAEEDQKAMALTSLARTMAMYRAALLSLGFQHDEAFELTRDLQAALFDQIALQDPDD